MYAARCVAWSQGLALWVHWLNFEAGAGGGALLLLLGLTFDTLMDTLGLPCAQRIRHVWCTNGILVAVNPRLSGLAHLLHIIA